MRRLKKVAAIVSLMMVISMGANVALAGTQETPGYSLRVTTEVTTDEADMSATGVMETPGFDEMILFAMTLIM